MEAAGVVQCAYLKSQTSIAGTQALNEAVTSAQNVRPSAAALVGALND